MSDESDTPHRYRRRRNYFDDYSTDDEEYARPIELSFSTNSPDMFAESGVGSDISSGIIDLCDDSDDDDVVERQPIYLEDQGVLEKVFAEEWDYVPGISAIQPNDEQATIDAIFDQEDPFAGTTADAAAADATGAAATGNISPSPPSPDFDPSQARGLDDEVAQLEQQIEQAVSSDEAQQTAAQPRLINRKNPSARRKLNF
ncbi:uncharacterized protein LOC126842471 [Adelges cooleyi]|uniref:uncharacterized protein LOC126842471 n=1 Tax=Adelges cooleyi TaxID=133065 RepID=UPI00217F782D|nr:uncharacterized protein LOC126842471 [Adelges cooleyi]